MRNKVTWEEATEIVMENLENPEEMERLNDMWAEVAQMQTAATMDYAKELGVSEEDMIAGVFLVGATVGYCLGFKDGKEEGSAPVLWNPYPYDED